MKIRFEPRKSSEAALCTDTPSSYEPDKSKSCHDTVSVIANVPPFEDVPVKKELKEFQDETETEGRHERMKLLAFA